MHLNDKKAIGIENITIKIIKMAAEHISPVLSNLFNKCILKGIFPSQLKIAKIPPIHKKKVCTRQQTIVLYRFCPPFQKFLKKSFTNDLKIILHLAIIYQKNNLGLEQNILQIMLY